MFATSPFSGFSTFTSYQGHHQLQQAKARKKLQEAQPSRNPHLGVGQVVNVNYEEFFVTLRIVIGDDFQNQRVPVPITFPGAGARHFFGSMPEVGDNCVVGWMPQESGGAGPRDNEGTKTPVILAWIPPGAWLGHDWVITSPFTADEERMGPRGAAMVEGQFARTRHKRMHLRPGDIGASSSKGSDILLNEGVYITNRKANELRLRDQDQAFVVRSQQQFHVMSGARVYAGMIQRDAHLLQSAVFHSRGWATDQTMMGKDQSGGGEPWMAGSAIGAPDAAIDFLRMPRPPNVRFEPILASIKGKTGTDPDKKAVYGGKPIFRVAYNEQGYTNNAELTGAKAFSEYRIEVDHTTDGILPVSEQTEGVDLDRMSGNRGQAFIEFALGTVVGNNAFNADRALYGVPLRPVVFDGPTATPSISSAAGFELGEQAATLFRVHPVAPGDKSQHSGSSWTSFTKDGRFKARIGGPEGTNSVEVSVAGTTRFDTAGLNLSVVGPLDLSSGPGTDGENVGLRLGSAAGAVVIESGGKIEGVRAVKALQEPESDSPMAAGAPKAIPSMLLKGQELHMESEEGVLIGAGGSATITAKSGISLNSPGQQINLNAGDGTIILRANEVQHVAMGRETRKYSGANGDRITELPMRHTSFTAGGPISNGVCFYEVVDEVEYANGGKRTSYDYGDRESVYNIGAEKTICKTGKVTWDANTTSKDIPGLNQVTFGATIGFMAEMQVGSVKMTSTVGSAKVGSKTKTTIAALGQCAVEGNTIAMSAPGSPLDSGGVICSGHIHPIIGQPLGSIMCGKMGSMTITIRVGASAG